MKGHPTSYLDPAYDALEAKVTQALKDIQAAEDAAKVAQTVTQADIEAAKTVNDLKALLLKLIEAQ